MGSTNKGTATATAETRARVAAMVESIGAVKAAAELRSSRETVCRIAGGLPVRVGSLAMVVQALEAPRA